MCPGREPQFVPYPFGWVFADLAANSVPLAPRARVVVEPPAKPAYEKDRLVQALDAHHWRRDEAARALGISRTTLWRKMRECGLID